MQSIVADTTPLNYLVLIQAADILDPSRCEGRDGSCKHSRRRARVDFAASCMVGSCEPETARRFGSGTSRRRRAGSDIPCVRTPSHPSVDGRTRRCDYSSASWIESGRHARSVGPCCSPWTRRVANHVRTVARDHVPLTGSTYGEHAGAGCRAQETSRRSTVTDKVQSGYNKGTIRSAIRYLLVSKDVRRHRLISI